jgi:hypothetical protein
VNHDVKDEQEFDFSKSLTVQFPKIILTAASAALLQPLQCNNSKRQNAAVGTISFPCIKQAIRNRVYRWFFCQTTLTFNGTEKNQNKIAIHNGVRSRFQLVF